jgi:YesN/AraC family two-component response regulator
LADSPLRSAKNIGIVVITLASRSAIRGGVLPEVAFSLSDSYIQQLEHVTDITSVQYLIRKAELQYAEMVREQMQKEKGPSVQKSPYISQCQNYIYSHLHDKITVQELAKELGIHANYLSGLFKEQMGISLSRYILEEKVSRAKNLLVYSQYSFIEIAAYLGFSSQSYFSLQFKKVTGYTPKAYRDTFAVQDF